MSAGESKSVGEVLRSDTGRFRLFLFKYQTGSNLWWAELVLMGYSKHQGKQRLWTSERVSGRADTDFRFTYSSLGASTLHGVAAFGGEYEIPVLTPSFPRTPNLFLEVWDNGELVSHSLTEGHYLRQWASPTVQFGESPYHVAPNTVTCEITQGQIATSDQVAVGYIENHSSDILGVADGSTYRVLPPFVPTNPSLHRVDVIGSVAVDSASYEFGNLAPGSGLLSRSVVDTGHGAADARGNPFRIIINPGFGLSLYAPFEGIEEEVVKPVPFAHLRSKYGDYQIDCKESSE